MCTLTDADVARMIADHGAATKEKKVPVARGPYGCGSLVLRLGSHGRASWLICYRLGCDGSTVFTATLGRFPFVGVEEARRLACEKFKHIAELRYSHNAKRTRPSRPQTSMSSGPIPTLCSDDIKSCLRPKGRK